MPSASVNKPTLEAQRPTEATPAPSSDNTDPIRQILKTVEHKIRNLDKRKSKLEGYQDLRTSGKNLTTDQEVAVSKYEEVVQCLLCAQDLLKQIQGIAVVYEKEQKNIQRKETAARVANEVFKVRETLVLQDIIAKLRRLEVRSDFETGSNGAPKLEAEDLALVDKLLAEGFVSLDEADTEATFSAHAHRAADHWVSTVDGKPKQFSTGITYERVRRVVRTIQDSGYFQRRWRTEEKENGQTVSGEEEGTANGNTEADSGRPGDEGTQERESPNVTPVTVDQQPLSSASQDVNLAPTIIDQTPIPVLINKTETTAPTVLPTVGDQVFVNAQLPTTALPLPPQPVPLPLVDPNALPEELQSGAFSFLQDSELEIDHHPPGLPHPPQPTQEGHPGVNPQQAPLQSIPTQPPANMLLINQIIPIPGLVQGAGGAVPNGIGGGVTPPMFPFPFQSASMANMSMHGQQAVPLNPVQQLVKTLSAANFNHHHQQQQQQQQMAVNAAPVIHNMNGNQHGSVVSALPQTSVPAGFGALSNNTNGSLGTTTGLENGTSNGSEKTPAEAAPPSNPEQLTISEWDPVGKGDNNGQEENKNRQEPRETSGDSSGDRRREDRRNGGGGGRPNGNENGGGGGGFHGSRRRFMDRQSNGGGGAGGGANYNGSRMHRNGNGITDSDNSAYRQGGGGKSHHYNRMSNGGGGQNGGSNGGSGGGSGTFYRNNDPNYYSQKPSRHSQGSGFTQPQRHGSATGNRN